jgi:hypothetical protein
VAEALLTWKYTKDNDELFVGASKSALHRSGEDHETGGAAIDSQASNNRSIRNLTKIFFDACTYVDHQVEDKISYKLTMEEYKGKIMAWDERTSTSPGSNMHLGHLRAYWAHHLLPEDSEDAKNLCNARETILGGYL